jgi:hypothetical protein
MGNLERPSIPPMKQALNTTTRDGNSAFFRRSPYPWCFVPFVCAFQITPLQAQRSPQSQSAEQNETVVELSPFVVTTDTNNGYAATNTLAGTRLNTPLKDIGTAISVVTKEFMDDIGASNAETLLTYTTGTEVGGLSGNFAGSPISDGRPDSNDQRENPNGNQRVRGLAPRRTLSKLFSDRYSLRFLQYRKHHDQSRTQQSPFRHWKRGRRH